MARPIGFSTGALAFGDFHRALEMMRPRSLPAVELSALREQELAPLVAALDSLDLSGYSYVSVHAPSSFRTMSERDAARLLQAVRSRRWPIIVHPDAISERGLWVEFGDCLCLENMDKRKPSGRTVAELDQVFEQYPDASFCFDIGHARQVDPTMTEAALILRRFRGRLRQVHWSEVTSSSQHEAVSATALNSFRKVAHLIPTEVPIILETVIREEQLDVQVRLAELALTSAADERDVRSGGVNGTVGIGFADGASRPLRS